jgi:ribose-phosphate pyrophosphokinase
MIITLDLVNKNKSDIQYNISQFPDGQQTIDLTKIPYYKFSSVEIRSRLNTFRDLEIIICAVGSLRNCNIREISLYVPYFMGARSDRQFQYGGVNYIKQVISPIINSLNFSSVTVIDPHSDVLEACITNFKKVNNFSLVKFALTDIDNRDDAQERITLVSPDAGAYKKIFDVAKEFKIRNIVTANKIRDLVSGQIISTEVPVTTQDAGKTFVIIDDICDGGRTFIEIAKAIRSITDLSSSSNQPTKIYLVVTHGIFSAGFKELNKYFDGIYSTNSYIDENDNEFSLKNDKHLNKLKQYNVF